MDTAKFLKYDEENPDIWAEFESLALMLIQRGRKHYGGFASKVDKRRISDMSKENQQQYCKKCGRDQRFEYSIRKEIWELMPKKWVNHVLCIECFLEELASVSPEQEIFLSDFAFLGMLPGGILVDNPNVITQ